MPPAKLPPPNGTYGVKAPPNTPPRALPQANRPSAPAASRKASRQKTAKEEAEAHREWEDNKARNFEAHRNFATGLGSMGFTVPKQMLPQSFYQVTVTVKGGPQASLRRLWYLACAAAFGRYLKSGFVSGRATAINGDWDVSGKAVTISLAQTETGIVNASFFGGDSGLRVLMDGPDQETVGRNWPAPILRGSPSIAQIAALSANTLLANAVGATGQALSGISVLGTSIGGAANLVGDLNADAITGSFAATQFAEQYRNGLISIVPSQQPQLKTFFLSRTDARVDPHKRVLFWNNDVPGAEALSLNDGGTGSATAGTGIATLSFTNPGSGNFTRSVGPLGGGYTVTRKELDVGLIDAGRLITTGSRNVGAKWGTPRPSVDGISRSHPLDMITAALSSPGYTSLATDGSTLAVSSKAAAGGSVYPTTTSLVVTAYNPSSSGGTGSGYFTVTPIPIAIPKASPPPVVPGADGQLPPGTELPKTVDERIK